MSLTQAQQLREKRHGIACQMDEIVKKAAAEDRAMTPEELQQFDKMADEVDSLKATYERIERAERENAESAEIQEVVERVELTQRQEEDFVTYQDSEYAMRAQLIAQQRGPDAVPEVMKRAAEKAGVSLDRSSVAADGEGVLGFMNLQFPKRQLPLEELKRRSNELTYRATTAQTITTTGGGHTANSELIRRLEIQLLAFGGMRPVANVMRSDHGNNMLFPLVDDTTHTGSILAINTAATVDAVVFGQKSIGVHKYTSGVVLVPMELLQDTAVDLVGFLSEALGNRVGRATNAHFTTGTTSTTNPVGVRVRATLGATTTATGSLKYTDFVNLIHSVDPLYRMNAHFMMHDNILRDTMKIVTGDGDPIWSRGVELGQNDRILRYPVQINQDMTSSSTAGASRTMLFGDFQKYVIRDVQGIDFLTLRERFATAAQTAYLTFSRHGGDTVFASTSDAPIRHLRNST